MENFEDWQQGIEKIIDARSTLDTERRHCKEDGKYDHRVIVRGKCPDSNLGITMNIVINHPPALFRFSAARVTVSHSRGRRAEWRIEFISNQAAEAQKRRRGERIKHQDSVG